MNKDSKDIKRIIDETQKLSLPGFDENKAWENVSQSISKKVGNRVLLRKILKYAAVVFFGLIVGVLVSKTSLFEARDDYVEIKARKGQKIDITLPDGNKIWINSNSSIKYPANFTEFNKKIYVQGEMYFKFSENNLSPISIIVNNVVIQGFNSAFNIKTSIDNQSAEITVLEGWVTVNNPEMKVDNIVIDEGYTCSFSSDLPLFVEENKNANFLAWKTGELHFKNTPLKVVATTLSEYYDMPVRVVGRIGYCNFSSDYKNADIKTILNDIQKTLTLDVNIGEAKIVIKGDDC